ncbi:hypothetical protein PTSG_12650 [Salpingoeca rosetta]|uniref:Solute carrier family 25 member 33 n=1 Tax=Salpingoeca rosetta (strain ATCC 50818 / BSB-021) TaxID=946362 RepID=F2UGK2_SALR5|nr:uncharacterized protein PTSG_12650 [Salpingoeca rosetta]EGD75752.1 hypothetical protein PTSG_12650 [Salpingoeca rosetta]|eukprot:XP_004991673.1 hypothetical protein PTSG_12650 [Salpingoeca rosetta]
MSRGSSESADAGVCNAAPCTPTTAASSATTTATTPAVAARTSEQQVTPRWVHFVSGGVGGCISATVTCPLEVVKTRMQSSLYTYTEQATRDAARRAQMSAARRSLYAFSQTAYALRETAAKEGVAGLWRGLGPMLLGVVPARSIYFLAYSQLKPHISSATGVPVGHWATHLSASACAALCSTTVVSPIWVVKTQVQLLSVAREEAAKHGNSGANATGGGGGSKGAATSLSNARAVAANIWRTDGLRGFFRGWTASAAGVVETAIQFTIYEQMKARLVNPESSMHGLQTFGVSALAKFCAIMLTYPHEVLRTRLRQEMHEGPRKYRGFFQTLMLVYREEGARALYRGMAAHMMRSVPNAAILILSYEVGLRLFLSATEHSDEHSK